MAVSRPSAPISSGSLKASSWTAKDTSQIRAAIRRAREAGDYQTVEHLCLDAYAKAIERGDVDFAAKLLSYSGGAQFAQFQYRRAFSTFFEARKLAESAGDLEELGGILFNLSSLFQQVWDTPSAIRTAQEGLAVTERLPNSFYKQGILLHLGRLQITHQPAAAEVNFRQGILEAHNRKDVVTEAIGLDLLGEVLTSSGDLSGAETSFLKAYHLRLAKAPSQVGYSLARLGILRLAQALAEQQRKKERLREAEQFVREALRIQADPRKPSFRRYALRHLRGQIRSEQGDASGALEDFRAAINEAQSTRQHFLPAASSFAGANAGLEETVFDSFVEAAAGRALSTGSSQWAREAFLAAEVNRAASLRQNLEIADLWRKKLPTEYWETLAALRGEEARLMAGVKSHNATADHLELRLSEMEAQAGLTFSQEKFEMFDDFRSLKHILDGLRESEVLLSFHLGERKSFLWAVTRNSLRLYPLASRNRIQQSIKEFRDAVQWGRPDADKLGRQLYQDLFGQLGDEKKKTAWLLSLENALFELPFAALVPESGIRNGESMYLVEQHSLQIVPSVFLLKQQPGRLSAGRAGTGRMVAVGDPIYNTADPRWRQSEADSGSGLFGWTPFQIRPFSHPESHRSGGVKTELGPSVELNRLVGSAEEADAVAQAWGASQAIVLKGSQAGRERLLESLTPVPDVIHLATHVLAVRLSQKKSFIMLGLGKDRQPELLSESDIGLLHVPDSLVVMTGCATATGDILAGAGLQGLTEAWAVAGARGVVATQWPMKDYSGDFLPGFYNALSSSSTAEALKRTQVAMIHSGTAYAAPSAWANYQLFGGAR